MFLGPAMFDIADQQRVAVVLAVWADLVAVAAVLQTALVVHIDQPLRWPHSLPQD